MQFFRKGLEDSITLPPHPSSKGEIQEVRDAMDKRTAKDVESARNHDRVPFYAIKKSVSYTHLTLPTTPYV